MRTALIFMLLLLLTSCVKTKQKLITAHEECRDKLDQMDMEDYRDPYDECLISKDEELKTRDGCMAACEVYCERVDWVYKSSWIDLPGCRCICRLRPLSG